MPEIGKRIRAKREELGLTQEELASKLGYKSKTTIAKIENGTNDIVQSKVAEFAKVLGTTPAYLMGWTKFDDRCSGKEADDGDPRLNKLAANILKFHGDQKRLFDNYEELSDTNKKKVVNYSDNLLAIQRMEEEQLHLIPDAAHDRTDISDSDRTDSSVQHDENIMNDPNF